jgi:hypothetical protein
MKGKSRRVEKRKREEEKKSGKEEEKKSRRVKKCGKFLLADRVN